jgi:diaminopimelate epimerase
LKVDSKNYNPDKLISCEIGGEMIGFSWERDDIMLVKFVKTHNAGNDFLLFDGIASELPIQLTDEQVIQQLCHRQFGVGADGIMLLTKDENSSDLFNMRIYNNDGSLAAMCGNGLSCLSRYIVEKGYHPQGVFRVMTDSGIRIPDVTKINEAKYQVRMNMGAPQWTKKSLPMTTDSTEEQVLDFPITVNGKTYIVSGISVGNPHCVIFDHPGDLWREYGAAIEKSPLFPDRINVEFVEVVSRNEVNISVWERGAGPTLACGTGASAVGVAGVLTGRTASKITAHLPGGDLIVEYNKGGDVFLTCQPEVSFRGEVPLK